MLSALKTSKKGRFEKSSPTSFSNPPLFERFSFENLKNGRIEKLGFSGIRTLYPLARTNTRSVRQRGPNSNERPPFWRKCPGNVVVWRNKRFLKPTPFWGFQPWKPQKRVGLRNWWEKISQTYPILKVSALKTSKKGRFEKLVEEDFSSLPPFLVEKSVGSKPLVSQQAPCYGIF